MKMSAKGKTCEVDDIREILRRIAPYIIRQWREVCLELGVQEEELTKLETEVYNISPASLACKGLSLWHDKVGHTATKDTLVAVLRRWGLQRAEDEIANIELSQLMVSTVTPRAMSARLLSAKRKTAMRTTRNGLILTSGYTSRPSSRNNPKKTRVKSSKKRQGTDDTKPCEIAVSIWVSQLSMENEVPSSWKEMNDFSEKLYGHIVNNCHVYIDKLETALRVREISVKEIMRGSVVVILQCASLGALESLNQMYRSKRLQAICQNVFTSENVLKVLGIKDISFNVSINSESMDGCRELFLSRKFSECTIVHPTDLLAPPTNDVVEEIPNPKELRIISKDSNIDRLLSDRDRIVKRFKELEGHTDEFLRTLQIILPKGRKCVTSLEELVQLHTYLSASETVASGVRADLVREYLSIVNNIRLLLSELRNNILSTSSSPGNKRLEINGLKEDGSFIQCVMTDIEDMLSPKYIFEEDLSALGRKLTTLEKTFSALLCHIPLLIAKLTTVLTQLQ